MKEKTEFLGVERKEYCPFIREQSERLLISLLDKCKPKRILEIGTFLGYSASLMLECCPSSTLVTVEKDKQNYLDAKQNLFEYGDRVEIVNADAQLFLEKRCEEKFDFVFLDGPKGQYIRYLPFLKKMLNVGGILVADDVLFYGMVNSSEKIDHKHRALVNNLRQFLAEIGKDSDLETVIYDFDDGVSVSKKLR